MRPVLLLLLGSTFAFAQPFSAGIKAGIPLTDFLNAASNGTFNYSAPNQRYIIGGVAEVRFPLGIGVEFDALYRKLSYTGSGTIAGITGNLSAKGNDWEFPLLLKYRFHVPVARPYLDAGVAWDTLPGLKNALFKPVSPRWDFPLPKLSRPPRWDSWWAEAWISTPSFCTSRPKSVLPGGTPRKSATHWGCCTRI